MRGSAVAKIPSQSVSGSVSHETMFLLASIVVENKLLLLSPRNENKKKCAHRPKTKRHSLLIPTSKLCFFFYALFGACRRRMGRACSSIPRSCRNHFPLLSSSQKKAPANIFFCRRRFDSLFVYEAAKRASASLFFLMLPLFFTLEGSICRTRKTASPRRNPRRRARLAAASTPSTPPRPPC